MTAIKQPVAIDVSHYKIIPSFALVQPKPFLVFTKATECYPGTPFNNIVDPTFAPYFADMKANGILRGAYHFFRRAYDAVKQAKHFVETVLPHIDAEDTLILDFEEEGVLADQLISFADYVQGMLTNRFMIYSRALLMNPMVMTTSQKARLKSIYTWAAGYPYFPDLYSEILKGYIPDQTKWGPVASWQYATNGKFVGISGGVDVNLLSPWFHAELLAELPPKTKTAFSFTLDGYKPFTGEAEKL